MRLWETTESYEDHKTKETREYVQKWYEWEDKDFSRLCMIITEMHKTNIQIADEKKSEWIKNFISCAGMNNGGEKNKKDPGTMIRDAYWKLYKRTLKDFEVSQVVSSLISF